MFFKKKSSESASCEDSENSNTDKSKQNSVQTENQGNSAGWWHNFSHFHQKVQLKAKKISVMFPSAMKVCEKLYTYSYFLGTTLNHAESKTSIDISESTEETST